MGANLAPNRPPKENMTSKVNFPPSPNNDPIAEKSKHDDPFSRNHFTIWPNTLSTSTLRNVSGAWDLQIIISLE